MNFLWSPLLPSTVFPPESRRVPGTACDDGAKTVEVSRPLHRRGPETVLEVDPGQTRGHGTVTEHKGSFTKRLSGLTIMSEAECCLNLRRTLKNRYCQYSSFKKRL